MANFREWLSTASVQLGGSRAWQTSSSQRKKIDAGKELARSSKLLVLMPSLETLFGLEKALQSLKDQPCLCIPTLLGSDETFLIEDGFSMLLEMEWKIRPCTADPESLQQESVMSQIWQCTISQPVPGRSRKSSLAGGISLNGGRYCCHLLVLLRFIPQKHNWPMAHRDISLMGLL